MMMQKNEAIESQLKKSLILPADLTAEIEDYIEANKHSGYKTLEEFVLDAVRRRISILTEKYETIEIPKEDYDEIDKAIDEMYLPFRNVADFIHQQIRMVLERYEEFKEKKEEYMKRQREEYLDQPSNSNGENDD